MPPPKATYQEGQMIGGTPYRVVRFLGGGGMGSVYEVEDTTIGKHYVVKTLHSELAHRPDLVKMLRQEARLLARVKHKNIVDVITAGKTSDDHGLPFIVMEKLDGITLKGLMQTHRLPWQFVRQIANELLEALYRMHHPAEGLPMIHRDIKPENIFLAKDDDGKYITKLLDLGIASWLDGQKHQGFHGTLKYAAPEQLRCEPLTERTDLYQAGLVFFEMLTGRHPFADAREPTELVDASLVRTPPRVTELADVPRRVDDVIDAALSKNPAKRPRDAYVFMTALQDLREQPASRAPDLANTTMEDLHTAIAKHTETGYEEYATSEGSTLEGMSAPPFENRTLRDAFPSFAVASTDVPRAMRGATVPLAPPPQAMATPAEPGTGVDREAATRSLREAAPRPANNDTEELLDGLMPPELAALREQARLARADKLPWGPTPAQTAPSRRDDAARSARTARASSSAASSEPSTATPLAAEIAPQIPGLKTSRRAWLFVAALVLLATGMALGTVARRRTAAASAPASSSPSARAVAGTTSASARMPVSASSVPAERGDPGIENEGAPAPRPSARPATTAVSQGPRAVAQPSAATSHTAVAVATPSGPPAPKRSPPAPVAPSAPAAPRSSPAWTVDTAPAAPSSTPPRADDMFRTL
jgi:eukaryotic-like serine/threonine-protein kinase